MISKSLASILSDVNDFHSHEVVDRVSETQVQVGENYLNPQQFFSSGWKLHIIICRLWDQIFGNVAI